MNYSNSDSLSLTLHRTLYSIFAVHYNSRCLVLSSHHNSRCLIFSLHHILPYPIIAMWRSLVRRIHHSSRSPRLSSLRFTSATGLLSLSTVFPALLSYTVSSPLIHLLSLSLSFSFFLSLSLSPLSLTLFLSLFPSYSSYTSFHFCHSENFSGALHCGDVRTQAMPSLLFCRRSPPCEERKR